MYIEDACGESPPPPHPPCTPSLHTQFEKEKEKEKQKDKEKEKEKGKEKEKEKEREKEKEKEKQRLNSFKYSFIMFEVSVENRFEINENYLKMIKKVTKKRVWSGSGTKWGTEHQKRPPVLFCADHFGGHFGGQIGS